MPLSKSLPEQPSPTDQQAEAPQPVVEAVAVVATASDADLLARKLVPPRRPGRWISAAVAAVLLAMLVHTVVANPRFQWAVVGQYFAASSIINGLELTLWLTAAVMGCGYALGIGLACMRLSGNPVLRGFAFLYVWLFRSVPVLVQLLFWYELASFFPTLSLGIPFGPAFVTANTAHLFSGVFAAFVALSLDVAAFSAEIVRGGILAVDPGQSEAAQALGLGRWRTFRRIVLPQAMPAIVPASGNMLIGTLKSTSLVSVIAVVDLLYAAQLIYNADFQVIPLLLVVTIWYTLITTVLSVGQYYVERYYARGTKRRPPARTLRQITRANLPLFPQGPVGSVGSIGGL
jgi:polar amino acid transport system permease protein